MPSSRMAKTGLLVYSSEDFGTIHRCLRFRTSRSNDANGSILDVPEITNYLGSDLNIQAKSMERISSTVRGSPKVFVSKSFDNDEESTTSNSRL